MALIVQLRYCGSYLFVSYIVLLQLLSYLLQSYCPRVALRLVLQLSYHLEHILLLLFSHLQVFSHCSLDSSLSISFILVYINLGHPRNKPGLVLHPLLFLLCYIPMISLCLLVPLFESKGIIQI